MDKEFLGAIYAWCWFDRIREYLWCLIYWPVRSFTGFVSQVLGLKRLGYYSGFMPRARGLHFTNKLHFGRYY